MKLLIFFLFSCLFFSCNRAFFVRNNDIIFHKKGYILFYYDQWAEAFFFPWKNTNDDNFLRNNHLTGFRLNGEDLSYYKNEATTKFVYQSLYPDGKLVRDSIKMIPVEINYYWGDNWKLRKIKQQQVNIKYILDDRQYDLFYTIYNDRHLLSISTIKR